MLISSVVVVEFRILLAVAASLACVVSIPTKPADHGSQKTSGIDITPFKDALRRVEVVRRAGHSDDRPFSMWSEPRAPTLAETMEWLNLRDDDLGAQPIANFRRLHEDLFTRIPRSQEALQALASVYRPYQTSHPLRGERISLEGVSHLVDAMLETPSRNRIRDMRAVLSHLIDNADTLGLDRVRREYLEALRDRFHFSARLLTPTPDEIIGRYQQRARTATSEELDSDVARTLGHIDVRTRLAHNNVPRFDLDFYLLRDLERSLDSLVRGADARMATGFTAGRHPFVKRDGSLAGPDQKSVHDLHRRRIFDSDSQNIRSGSSPVLPVERVPTDALLHRLESDQDQHRPTILPDIYQAPEQRRELIARWRSYQTVVPVHGRALDLDNAQLLTRALVDDVGRDRFRHMEPILSYLLANRMPLGLDRRQSRFLQALQERFSQVHELMSPTLNDLGREQQRAQRAFESGILSPREYRAMLRAIEQGEDARSMRAMTTGTRFRQELRLIRILERELEHVAGSGGQMADVGRYLVRRSKTPFRKKLLQRGNPSTSAAHETPASETELSELLWPLGMHLGDAHARPIAVWRYHSSDLMADRVIPADLKAALKGMWIRYREQHKAIPIGNWMLSDRARLYPYLVSDEGARFSRANNIIQFLIDNRGRLQLVKAETDYLRALKSRFDEADHLMRPLPGTIFESIKAQHPDDAVQERSQRLVPLLRDRRARIEADIRRVSIDTKLLHSFESEMDHIHGMKMNLA